MYNAWILLYVFGVPQLVELPLCTAGVHFAKYY